MSEPIKVGDLVIVVHPSGCCGGNNDIGTVFSVLAIQINGGGNCEYCREMHGQKLCYACCGTFWWPLRRLKRIPPLSELEGEKRDEEITA